MEGFAETPAVIKVEGEGIVAEEPEGLVVVAVHVAREKVKHRHVH